MMLRSKKVYHFALYAADPDTGARRRIYPLDYLTVRQFSKMVSRPDMIRQFARYVADKEQVRTGLRPIVTARVVASLNGRPPQALIDPKVDLAVQPPTLGPGSWVVPLQEGRRR
jgi:hypothetical protein